MANQTFVFLIIFYIIAFIYVKEPHYKYFGYIMLLIVYLAFVIVGIQNIFEIIAGFNKMVEIGTTGTEKFIYNATSFSILCIVFFNIYGLIRVINAYWFRTKTMKSFDLHLSARHNSNLIRFDNAFIVGNLAFALLIFSFILPDDMFGYKKIIQSILLLVSFICTLIVIAYSTMFSYIKRD